MRNRQPERFGRLEVDDQLELRRIFDRQVAGIGTLQNFIDISCRSPKRIGQTWGIGDETAGFDVGLLSNMVGMRCLVANSMMIGLYAVVIGLGMMTRASGRFCVIAAKALGKSFGSFTSRDWSVTRSLRAADCIACQCRGSP